MESVFYDDGPQRIPVRVTTWKLSNGEVCLLGVPVWVKTHWDSSNRRSFPCLGAGCHICPDIARWHAYFPCLRREPTSEGKLKTVQILLDLPSGAALNVVQQLAGRSPHGQVFNLKKLPSGGVRVEWKAEEPD